MRSAALAFWTWKRKSDSGSLPTTSLSLPLSLLRSTNRGGPWNCFLNGSNSISELRRSTAPQDRRTENQCDWVVPVVELPTSGAASTTLAAPSSANPVGTTGEPISTVNGNYFYQRTDFVLP